MQQETLIRNSRALWPVARDGFPSRDGNEYSAFKFDAQEWGRFLALVSILACLLFLTGCATPEEVRQNNLNAVKTGKKVAVLFRVTLTTEKNGQSVRGGIPFTAQFGSLDHHQRIEKFDSQLSDPPWVALPSASNMQGWRCLLLDPGSYYLKIVPQVLGADVKEGGDLGPFYLYIPPGKPIAYAGSFEFGKYKLNESWGKRLFGPGLGIFTPHSIRPLGFRAETNLAISLASQSLAQFGDVAPSFPTSYYDLSNATGIWTNHQIAKVMSGSAVSLASTDAGKDVDAKIAGPVAGPLLAAGGLMFAASDATESRGNYGNNDDVRTSGEELLAGFALILAAAPFVIAADATFGEAARKKWAPYEAKLEAELNQFNLAEHLASESGRRFMLSVSTNTCNRVAAPDSKLAIQIQPYRVLLRETRYKKFALEVAVQVKLVDLDSKFVLWAHDYVYTDAERARGEVHFLAGPLETLINSQATIHGLEEYEQPAGAGVFHHELDEAVKAISNDMAVRFRLAGFTYAAPVYGPMSPGPTGPDFPARGQ